MKDPPAAQADENEESVFILRYERFAVYNLVVKISLDTRGFRKESSAKGGAERRVGENTLEPAEQGLATGPPPGKGKPRTRGGLPMRGGGCE
jgi:hypothetical protein